MLPAPAASTDGSRNRRTSAQPARINDESLTKNRKGAHAIIAAMHVVQMIDATLKLKSLHHAKIGRTIGGYE
jgi:hypothetical protein